MPHRLVLVQPDSVQISGNTAIINTKTLRGLCAYADLWPGDLTVLATEGKLPSTNQYSRVTIEDLPFDLRTVSGPSEIDYYRRGAAATLLPHLIRYLPVLQREPNHCVLVGEFTLTERIRVGLSTAKTTSDRVRIMASHLGKEPAYRRMVRKAGGFSANGYPAYKAYSHLSKRSILFFDTRVTARHLELGKEHVAHRRKRRRHNEMTLAFSGRHIAAKGIEQAIIAYGNLPGAGLDFSLQIIGEDNNTPHLIKKYHGVPGLTFLGSLEFDREWAPHVAREVDLMVLPHIQGDPSGTYLEAAAAGVPTLSFANRAFQPLAKNHGLGWTVPMNDINGLTAKMMWLKSNQDQLELAGQAGLHFMTGHTFEREFAKRIEHIRNVAQV